MSRIQIITFFILLCSALFSPEGHAQTFTRVVIDAGHGGKDKGAMWGGVRESDLNLKVAKKVQNLLEAHGIPCTMTRSNNYFVSLAKRARVANSHKNTVFLSIHFNASIHTYVQGIETYYASAKGKQLAREIQYQMLKKLPSKNRKTRFSDKYVVLNQTHGTAVLVECGYISNMHERKKCNTSWYQSLAASAIVEGLLKYRSLGKLSSL